MTQMQQPTNIGQKLRFIIGKDLESEKHFKSQWKSTILQKKVDLSNICASVKYFLENNSITGQIISVDSGQSLAWKTPDIINSKE